MNAADRTMLQNFDDRIASIMPREHLEAMIKRFAGTRQEWAAVLARKNLINQQLEEMK